MQYSLLPQESRNLLPFQGEAYFHPDFFSLEEADQLFKVLQEGLAWQQEPIWMFGKQILQPRLTALYGDPKVPYGYSGIAMQAFHLQPNWEASKSDWKDLRSMSSRTCSAIITVMVKTVWVGIETTKLC
jgi:hypothetical protein